MAAAWDLQEAFVSQLTTLNFVCGVALPSTPRRHDGMLFRPNPLPKRSPSANVAQVELPRGILTCLSQTGEGFLLTFDRGRQDVSNKNVAQVEMSRGTLTCLSQTGERFLLTFGLGRQDVRIKNCGPFKVTRT